MSKIDLNALRDRAYKIACEHGFHDNKLSNEHCLMLVITELSEAVEADRKGKRSDVESYKLLSTASKERTGNLNYFNEVSFRHHVKDTVEDELSDAVIRLLDLAGLRNIDIEDFTEEDIEDLSESCNDETFTESIYAISILPKKTELEYNYKLGKQLNYMLLAIFGLAKHLNIDLMWHIEQKMKYNELREKMHGKKY